jgi:hypothetical protein
MIAERSKVAACRERSVWRLRCDLEVANCDFQLQDHGMSESRRRSSLSPRMGQRPVATSGAQRNSWDRTLCFSPRSGRRKLPGPDSVYFRSDLRGGAWLLLLSTPFVR